MLRQDLGLGAFAAGFRDGEEGGKDGPWSPDIKFSPSFDMPLLTVVIARRRFPE
jgi:hypothetical protein